MIEALLERIEIRPAAYAYRSRFGRTPPAMPQRPSLTKRNIDADREEFAACRLSILAWPAVVISSPTEAFDRARENREGHSRYHYDFTGRVKTVADGSEAGDPLRYTGEYSTPCLLCRML